MDKYFAEVLTQDKAAKVKQVQSRAVSVAMASDGGCRGHRAAFSHRVSEGDSEPFLAALRVELPRSPSPGCGLMSASLGDCGHQRAAVEQRGKKHDHEKIEIGDQGPHLRNDRGRSNRSPRRTRWENVLLLQRPLSAKVSVHARRDEARGNPSWLLWITLRGRDQPILARNECVNTSFAATRNQMRTQEKAKYSYE